MFIFLVSLSLSLSLISSLTLSSLFPFFFLFENIQGKTIHNSPALGTLVSNQSLALQRVTRMQAGLYTCVGSNQEGDGESSPLYLDVKCKFTLFFFLHSFISFCSLFFAFYSSRRLVSLNGNGAYVTIFNNGN